MPVTVGQALETDIFSGASVVAGAKGLNNPIRWVHVCELPDCGSLLSGNELVLTTGNSLRTRTERVEYIQGMALAKVAALVVFLSHSFPKLPSYWLELADEWAIPVILAPPEKSFITVSEEVSKFLQAEAIEEARRRLPRPEMEVTNRLMAFFQDVLSGEIGSRGFVEITSDRLGLPLGGDYCVAVFRYTTAWNQQEVYQAASGVIEAINDSSINAWCIPAAFWHGRITLVISIGEEDTSYQLKTRVRQVNTHLEKRFPRWKVENIGLSRPYSLFELSRAYREARQASEVRSSRKNGKDPIVRFFGDLGLYRLLYAVEDKRELVSFYRESVSQLVEYDRTYRNDLLRTLEVYFQHEGNLKETAEALYIHRHTLRYRLQRVEVLTGLKLNRFEDRLSLLLGLMIWQMLRGEREIFYPNV